MQDCELRSREKLRNESEDRLHFRLISLVKMTKEIARFHNAHNDVFVKKMKGMKPLSFAGDNVIKKKTDTAKEKQHNKMGMLES